MFCFLCNRLPPVRPAPAGALEDAARHAAAASASGGGGARRASARRPTSCPLAPASPTAPAACRRPRLGRGRRVEARPRSHATPRCHPRAPSVATSLARHDSPVAQRHRAATSSTQASGRPRPAAPAHQTLLRPQSQPPGPTLRPLLPLSALETTVEAPGQSTLRVETSRYHEGTVWWVRLTTRHPGGTRGISG